MHLETTELDMPDFKGDDNFLLVLLFVVPGLVALSVRSRFITGRTPSAQENILNFVVLSLVYYSLTIFFIESAFSIKNPWIVRAGVWIILLLVGPAIFGFFLGAAAQKEWFTWLADRLNLTIVHVIPAAWDWRFSSVPRGGMFVMVTLNSGERVAGFFGNNSFASSDTGERDLYIEEEYTVTDEGDWEPRTEKVGVLISAKEIRYIEFWNPQTTTPQTEQNLQTEESLDD
jgi:hypothetical protein